MARTSRLVRLRRLLPKGVPLTDEAWQRRHRLIQAVLWLQVPILLVVGLARGFTPAHVVVEVSPIAVLALVGYTAQGRGAKAIMISIGLLTTEAILVHFTGGLIEAHFAFFVTLPLIALYQDLRAFSSRSAQHARNSDLAAQATDLSAQATRIGSLVTPVGAR